MNSQQNKNIKHDGGTTPAAPRPFLQTQEWPVTRMPDPEIKKPEPETDAEDDAASTLDGFVIPTDPKELYKLWLKTEHEFRVYTERKNTGEVRLASAKLKLLRPAYFKSQQGMPRIANSAEQVGVALALHNSPDSEYLKWKIAVEGNYSLRSLLGAYDELKSENLGLRTALNYLLSDGSGLREMILKSLGLENPELPKTGP